MDEEHRVAAHELVELRGEQVEVCELRCPDAGAGEAVRSGPAASGTSLALGRGSELENPVLVGRDELGGLVARQRADAQGRLQRHDGDVELPAVEEREPGPEVVGAEVDLALAFAGELERGAAEPRRTLSTGQELDERLRPQVLMEVDRGHVILASSHPLARRAAAKRASHRDLRAPN